MTQSHSSSLSQAIQSLESADSADYLSGLIGLGPEALFHTINSIDLSCQAPEIWIQLHQTAIRAKNLAIPARLLWMLARSNTPSQCAAIQWITLGHFLRFIACDNLEAIKAYQCAASGNWPEKLTAAIALHRLRRTDPLIKDASAFIEAIQQKFPLNLPDKNTLETNLQDSSSLSPSSRASFLAQQAIYNLLFLGDLGHAISSIEEAVSGCPQCDLLPDTAACIALAVPDSTPVLQKTLSILVKLKAWNHIQNILQSIEHLPFTLPDECMPDIIMMFALQNNDQFRAAHYLYTFAGTHSRACGSTILSQSWICAYALNHPFFQSALFESLKLIDDSHVKSEVSAHFERFGKKQDSRTNAQIEQIRQMIFDGNIHLALDRISLLSRTANAKQAIPLFDALSDLIQFGTSQNCITYNTELIHTADALLKKSGALKPYQQFLRRCSNAVPNSESTSTGFQMYHRSIQTKLHAASDTPNNIISEINPLSAESCEILQKCQQLLTENQTDLSCRCFFDWTEKNVHPFLEKLSVFCTLNASISDCQTPFISIQQLLDNPDLDDACSVLAPAIILSPDYFDKLNQLNHVSINWNIVANTILRYVKYVSSPSELFNIVSEICVNYINRDEAFQLLTNNLHSVIQSDVLFKQVLQMSETTSQQQALLEQIDTAIAGCPDDIDQKNALYEKKYLLAQSLGDERMMMTCLRDILETTPDNRFACEELLAIDPASLMPHSQLLYFQLRLFTDASNEHRLENEFTLAQLYTQTSQFNNAITLYYTIIEEFPDFLEARYRLVDLLESLENWKNAENVLLALVNAETSPSNRYQSLIRLSNLQNDRLMVPSRALLTLFAALDIDPVKLNALHPKLCEISDRMRSFSPLLDKYEDISKHADDYSVRRMAAILLANVYAEHLKKPALACNVLDEFYNLGGCNDPEFLQIVASFYGEIKHWNGYLQMLTQMLSFTTDKAERATLALTIARTYADNLGDYIQAAQYAHIASEAKPRLAEQWLEIANFLMACESPDNAIQSLYNAASLTRDSSQKALILLETARLLSEMDKLEDAAQVFHAAADLRPPLEQLTPIAEALIGVTTAHQNQVIFNEICFDLVQCCPESERTPLILQQALTLARVFKANDDARRLIRDNMSRLSALDLDQSLILAQILTTLDEPALAMQVLTGIFKKFDLNREQKAECLREQLENAEKLDDLEAFRIASEALLELEPDDLSTTFRMMELDYHAGKWEQATERVEQLLPYIDQLNPDEAQLTHYYYSEILHASEQDELALEHLNRALAIHTNFRPAVDLKLTILLNHENWKEALPVFHSLLNLSEDPDVQGAIHKRIAELYHFYLQDPESAIFEYEQALTLGGDIEDVPIRLLQLYQELAMWQKAAMTAQILASVQVSSPEAKCTYLAILGGIQAAHLGELSEAVNTYLEAFGINPFDRDVLRELALLLIRCQEWNTLKSIFEHLQNMIQDSPQEIAEQLTNLAQTSASCRECESMIQSTAATLKMYGFDLLLEPISAQPAPIVPETQTRKRLTTSPRGSLTYDSSLLKNPEFTPQPQSVSLLQSQAGLSSRDNTPSPQITTRESTPIPQKILSQLSIPVSIDFSPDMDDEDDFMGPRLKSLDEIDEAPEQVFQLPDDALMPLDSLSSRNVPKTPAKSSAAFPAPRKKTSNILPTISTYKSEHVAAIRAIEDLTFTPDDILLLEGDAQPFEGICISDLLKLSETPHLTVERKPLPSELADPEARDIILTPKNSVFTPQEINVLKALATDKDSPALQDIKKLPKLEIDTLEGELRTTCERLRILLDCPNAVLTPRADVNDVTSIVMPTVPPAICCTPELISCYSDSEWTARIAFGMYLARPENLLCAALPANAVLQYMQNAVNAMMPATSNSDLDARTRLLYRKIMNQAGIKSTDMPKLDDDTLSKIKQYGIISRKQAIQTALLFSQSLIACIKLLTEIENLRFPSTLLTLKSAMKRSNYIRDLIMYGLGPEVENLYARIHP